LPSLIFDLYLKKTTLKLESAENIFLVLQAKKIEDDIWLPGPASRYPDPYPKLLESAHIFLMFPGYLSGLPDDFFRPARVFLGCSTILPLLCDLLVAGWQHAGPHYPLLEASSVLAIEPTTGAYGDFWMWYATMMVGCQFFLWLTIVVLMPPSITPTPITFTVLLHASTFLHAQSVQLLR
jgi:hypothetical protein